MKQTKIINFNSDKIAIEFKADKRIFVLFLALSLAASHKIHPLQDTEFRKEIINKLKGFNIPCLKNLKKIFKRAHYYQFLIWMLCHNNFPELKLKSKSYLKYAYPSYYEGFRENIIKFYKEIPIDRLWSSYLKESNRFIKIFYKPIIDSFKPLILFFGFKKVPFKKVIYLFDLLEGISSGTAFFFNKSAYIVLGPPINFNRPYKKLDLLDHTFIIQHELLHGFINPLFENKKINRLLKEKQKLINKFSTKKLLKEYPEWKYIIIEYTIRAICSLFIKNKTLKENYIKEQKRQGFVKIDRFVENLEKYQKQNKLNFNNYLIYLLQDCIKDKLVR